MKNHLIARPTPPAMGQDQTTLYRVPKVFLATTICAKESEPDQKHGKVRALPVTRLRYTPGI